MLVRHLGSLVTKSIETLWGFPMTTNRRIIIDNATLSGVERLTGTSQTLNLNYVDNDILCLEKLVTAILFSDQLIGVDDYKDEYRSKRLKNFDFINFSRIEADRYSDISADAAKFARSMTFSFKDTKPAGDVVSFFESLRIDPQLRWDVWVSSEYLTLSYLVDDPKYPKYERAIDSAFRNEATDCKLVAPGHDSGPALNIASKSGIIDAKSLVHAFKTSNPQYAGNDSKSALERLIFGYGWAAERSHFYNAIASMEGADVSLAPLRDAFCESCYRIDYPSQVSGLLQTLKDKSQQTLSSIVEPSGQAQFAMRLPFFTSYLISKTDNPKQCIDLALELRSKKEFIECRNALHILSNLSASDKHKEVNNILKYVDQSCVKLMKKYAVLTGNGLQFSLSVGLTGINLSVGTKLDQLFRHSKNQPFSRVFRNIAQDMLNVERLGGLHEKLCSSIREHENAQYPSIATTPKFMELKENEYGRPAKLDD